MRIAILTASPRPDGNSAALAAAFAEGARTAGHHVDTVALPGAVTGFLRDCRTCRGADGRCGIADDHDRLVHDVLAPADAVVFATPLYFYGMAAVLKTTLERLSCVLSSGDPRSAEVAAGFAGQRCALLVASEEAYPTLLGGLVSQVQETCRYLHQEFVGVVHGVGNRRGEVAADPADPVGAARRLGAELFDRRYTDYAVDTERAAAVW